MDMGRGVKRTLSQARRTTRRSVLHGIGYSGLAVGVGSSWHASGRGLAATPTPAPAPAARGVQLVALYGPPDDPEAFERYYRESHVPLAVTIPYLNHAESALVMASADGGPAPYHRIGILSFASPEEFQLAAASPEAASTLADIPTFATGGATLFIAHVDLTFEESTP